MIYTDLSINSNTGIGIIGNCLLKELSKLTEVKLFRKDLFFSDDEFDIQLFKSKFISDEEIENIFSGRTTSLDSTFLSYPRYEFPNFPTPKLKLKGTKNIGLAVFEHSNITQKDLSFFDENFDEIITACNWCKDNLEKAGFNKKISIIPHGIDPLVFNSSYSEKEFLNDKFVIFSGGKYEFRKGQDIVIKAFKYMQDKYEDVYLVASWFNPWIDSIKTMNASKLINTSASGKNYNEFMSNLLEKNGIDLNKVLLINFKSNYMMNRVYRNTDIGLFPNRCEAGTNIVLMEYMACGKPTIVSNSSGNRDVIKNSYSKIVSTNPFPITFDGNDIGHWDEPNLDEIIENLEWAYHNRNKIKEMGEKANIEMINNFTWSKIAEEFYKVLEA